MVLCAAITQKDVRCPIPALPGSELCHMHTYKAELEKTRKAEEEERASRGVRLCKGAGQAKCPDKTELPMTSPDVVCEACSTRAKERAKLNREKRLAATAERNKAKDGKKECVICHKDYPLADFEAEKRLKGGDTVSNKCKSCREKAKDVKKVNGLGERSKEKRLQEQAQRGELCDAAKKEGRRICSRQGSVTRGCWVVLPDDYEPATCEPCIKLREEYNAYKQAKLEAGKREGGDQEDMDEGEGDDEEAKLEDEGEEADDLEEAEREEEAKLQAQAEREAGDDGLRDLEKAAKVPRKKGTCVATVRTSGKPCASKAAPDSKYCKKHELDGVAAAIEERGGRVCSGIFVRSSICARELPAKSKFRNCEPCRNYAKDGTDKMVEKKRAKATAEIAALRELGVTKRMCANPKCCAIKDPSDFAFEETSDRAGWCSECRGARQDYVAKLPGGKRERTEADMERARAYEKTPARKASKMARKEADPERWLQYSRDSRERRRAADPEGYLARAAADQVRHRNRARVITLEGQEGTLEQTTAAQIIEDMDSCCFFCGEEEDDTHPLGIARLDKKAEWTLGNCIPSCATCCNMRRMVDAKTFVDRCVYLNDRLGGGVRSEFPAELFGDFPRGGQYADYLSTANKKNVPFALTKEEFESKVSEECYICDKSNGFGHHNGLDRVDNSLGYTSSNTRAACGDCNYMKGSMTLDKMNEQIKKIAERSRISLEYIPADLPRSTYHMMGN